MHRIQIVSSYYCCCWINGCLKEFIKKIKKSKSCANMSKLAYHELQGGAGEKGGKPKPKRRSYSSDVSDLPAEDRQANSRMSLAKLLVAS